MKPAPFTYHRAHDVEEAFGLLSELQQAGEDPKVIAGGQSLMAMMNFRLARPTALVDLAGLRRDPAASRIDVGSNGLVIGALATHHEVESAQARLGPGYDLIARAMRWVGHLPIRTRGTVGGSLAHADATAEWCLLALLMDASIEAHGPRGRRLIEADKMFQGFFTTALDPDEIITSVSFSHPTPHASLVEFARRHGDFAIVNVAVAIDMSSEGRIERGRVVVGGTGPVPQRVPEAEDVLTGAKPHAEVFAAAALAASAAVAPQDDSAASATYRRQLTRTLVERACVQAMEEAIR